MVVGLGTGSTARFAIEFIGEMVAAGVRIQGVPSSAATEKLARQHRIPLLFDFDEIDLSIDGADEVDGEGSLIKGGGGALAREKIVLAASKNQIIIVDESKVVAQLGSFPLPVEILPFGWRSTARQLLKLGCGVNLRKTGEKAYLTDNQNFILDCQFEKIAAPALMTTELNSIPGVTCVNARGAFYLFPNISKLGLKSSDFCARLLEQEKVAAVPGIAFGADDYIRLSYATGMANIEKGLDRLDRFCRNLAR